MPPNSDQEGIRQRIKDLVKDHEKHRQRPDFIPGKSTVSYAGRVFDECEVSSAVESALDFWLTLGENDKLFCSRFSELVGKNQVLTANSGSSANLLAVSALCSRQRDNPLKKGDEVITPASTFPTTLNPIIQNHLMPVFIDVDIPTYNIDCNLLEEALSEKTRALVVPHVLGNPADIGKLLSFAKTNGLYLIEDCCDALGSTYDGAPVGSFGDISTYSFYPAHHITMGEGGACATDDPQLYRTLMSLRDWGRDCYCTHDQSDLNGACKNRFGYALDGVKYDHRYIYSNIGYNLKPLDLQCAIGLAQLDKLPEFTKKRKHNFKSLSDGLSGTEGLILPKAQKNSDPNWFAYPISCDSDRFSRDEICRHLESKKIMTRALFTGNILRHPAYRDIDSRITGELTNTEKVFRDSFFIGVYPGITDEMTEYMVDVIKSFVKDKG